ncbi:ABC transporter substrate-binding protein [Allonocardiopsis opalescens]|uniref:Peptide/nickel transport system substrate-binding protein n=1 Tax=Allonocardiopsis opalescens TaxID=1144618 RepID=A0A2T0QEW3_9ACTN|nr:ABC transporter substrate-binding protein [Allonocardiopsis opalescens]PRY02430.1 peptide/nickel transport system substrate-binding protein [Allonocardiopsis opalescens]
MPIAPRPPRRPAASLGAAALALAFLASGCFGGPAPDDSGRLRVGLAFPPVAGMSPYSDDAALLGRMGAVDALTALDAEGLPAPRLAESWEQADDTTWRLELRDDVVFHDGTALTAEHAAAALNHAAAAAPVPRALAGVELTAAAAGEHTLEVTTAEPDPILPQRLSSPELVVLSPAAYAEDPASPDPVGTGTGPFELTGLGGDSTATLAAFGEHWAGAPAATGVDVRFIPDAAARAGALRAGEVDVIDSVAVAQLPNITEQEIVEVPLPRLVGLLLNTSDGPFADPGTRAAAAAAVDAAAIVAGIYEGRADTAEGVYGPASPWAAERPEPSPRPEPAEPGGTAITLATYSDRPELPEAASVVAEDLRAAGFEVEVIVREFGALETDMLAGAFDAVIGARSYLLDTGDPIGYLAADWSCEGSYNLARFCDEDVDQAISEAAALTEPAERNAAALEIEARILASAAVVPLANERTRLGVAPGVEGVAEDPYERALITAETRRP